MLQGDSVKNVTARVEGNKLVLEVDLSKDFGKSSTGASITVASTRFAPLEGHDGLWVNLGVGRTIPKDKRK
jgi:hypothetical protein